MSLDISGADRSGLSPTFSFNFEFHVEPDQGSRLLSEHPTRDIHFKQPYMADEDLFFLYANCGAQPALQRLTT